jgi:hypothetical protein
MKMRIERDVLVHEPTLVTLSVGVNDVLRGVTAEEYAADVREIVRQLNEQKIPMLILTTTILGEKHAAADAKLAEFNAALREIAKENKFAIAEVNKLMQAARDDKGADSLEADQVHITRAGYRLMVRAILDALGERDFNLPENLRLELMPGVVREWRIRPATAAETPLTEALVAKLAVNVTWKPYAIPEETPRDHWWEEQERQRGFVQGLSKAFGPAKSYLGYAEIESPEPREVYLNTGGGLEAIWLHDRQIFKSTGWTGWHAGKERVKVALKAGKNRLIIECGGTFFLSVTDDNKW